MYRHSSGRAFTPTKQSGNIPNLNLYKPCTISGPVPIAFHGLSSKVYKANIVSSPGERIAGIEYMYN